MTIHRNHRTAGREIRSGENPGPRLSAVSRLVEAALLAVTPQFSRRANINRVIRVWIDQNLRDALRILESHVGPILAAIGRFIDAVADRGAVTGPRFTGADPDNFRVFWIDRDFANLLYQLLVEI